MIIQGIDWKVLVNPVVDLVEDVAEKKQKNSVTELGIMRHFESMKNVIPLSAEELRTEEVSVIQSSFQKSH